MFACTVLYEVLPSDEDIHKPDATENEGREACSEAGQVDGIDIAALCSAVQRLLQDDSETDALHAAQAARAAVLRKATSSRYHAGHGHEIASPDFLRIINASAHYREQLCAELRAIQQSQDQEPELTCVPGNAPEVGAWEESGTAFDDARAWEEVMPAKVGLYHAFVRSQTREHCRHKLFIVVSGHCARAADEVRNLWLDFRDQLTAAELVQAEEMQWLRQTTLRNHGRVAARVAAALGVRVRVLTDEQDPLRRPMAIADSVTFTHDCCVEGDNVLFSNNAAFSSETHNGLLLDVFPNEGFWMFNGPADPSGCNAFGTQFGYRRQAVALPVNTLRVSPGRAPPCGVSTVEVDPARLPANICVGRAALEEGREGAAEPAPPFTQQFPDEGFMACMNRLGFERDDGVLHLMPLLVYCE